MTGYRHRRRRLMSEINVVPLIDVMLVLLVVFMITAPMLAQSVKVELPRVAAGPADSSDRETIIVTVDRQGVYFLNDRRVSEAELKREVAARLNRRRDTPVHVRGDQQVPYGEVVRVMALLKEAGAPGVGLITQPDAAAGRRGRQPEKR
ncbi:MAG: protein TolR [Candidatus Muproteobacteria bacterium RBG_16_62_13]|uniref:Tol-Pal system protein TolR n=1 Tax=Candidatus Muproteobacteria bacterium RBG_16_62_13 TaxID=1817756 RepID=A0A1F6T4C6_9PROT|nr:MAG: protein TolR [Candidatus Muproteobacteria bacterium RBG_16_62_13]